MCGVPFHAADGYIARLVQEGLSRRHLRAGRGSEEGQGARQARGRARGLAGHAHRRGLPRRARAGVPDGASRPAQPGARATASRCSISRPASSRRPSIAGADGRQALADELAVLRPREIVAPAGLRRRRGVLVDELRLHDARHRRRRLDVRVRSRRGARCSTSCRRTASKGSASRIAAAAVCAAGALVHYLRDTQKADLAHVREIAFRTGADCLLIDPTTLRHLEVVEAADGGRTGSLLDEIDRTVTSMGGRLLRGVAAPAARRARAHPGPARRRRGARVPHTERGKLRETLKTVHDLERLVARAALGTAGPRDLVALRQSLAAVPRVRDAARRAAGAARPQPRSPSSTTCADVRDELDRTLVDEPPALARDGGFIRDGVDAELDDLRGISRSGKQLIAEMEEAERARTGISSLKIRYNRVFGYYIEISKSNLAKRAGRLPPQADDRRRRAVHHAGAEGVRREGPRRRRADPRARGRALRARCAPAVAAEAPRIQDTARGAGDARRAGRRWPRRPPSTTTRSRTCTTATSSSPLDARHPVVERHAAGRVRAERRHARRRRHTSSSSSPGRTWAASPPTCGRRRCSA